MAKTWHEIQAEIDVYEWRCSPQVGHKTIDYQELVNMQCARDDAPKEKWYKRLI